MERSLILLLLTSPLVLFGPLSLFGMGGKPTVVKGQADYQAAGATEVVHVSDKTILEYRNFNIDAHETTRFEQPSDKSTLLCRVKGGNQSIIHGKLQANGKLLFVNPNGIFFSETAIVNVGSLIASVLDIKNDNFLKDSFKFELAPGSSKRAVHNKGRIEAISDVVFMAPNVVNQGVITAKTGKIVLVTGELITLDFDGDSMMQFAVEAPFKDGCIEQAGVLIAPEIYMHLPTAGQVIRAVLNTGTIVEANCIVCEEGVIRLKEGSYTSARNLHLNSGDAIQISGEIQVSELCDLTAGQEILWMRSNSVGKLVTQTPRLVMEGSLTAKDWAHHSLAPSSLTKDSATAPFSQAVFSGSYIPKSCEPLSITAPLHLHGDLSVSAPHHEVHFVNKIEGVGGLEIKACGALFSDNIDSKGLLAVDAQGPVSFGGTDYVARGHSFKGSSFTFTAGKEVQVSAESDAPIVFDGGRILLSENTSLAVSSKGGAIDLSDVKGAIGSNLTVSVPNNALKIGAVSGIDALKLTSNLTTLKSSVNAKSITLMGEGPIHVSDNVTANAGDLIAMGPLVFNAPEIKMEALGGSIYFGDSLSGNTKLELYAPEGAIELKGSVGSKSSRFQQLTLSGKKITQHGKVISTGPVLFHAEEIYLGHDIETNATITLDAPVTLFKNETIFLSANKYGKGQIYLTSTLDAATLETSLVIENGKSTTQIQGPIGRKGPLANLEINSEKITLGDVGGKEPGVIHLMKIKSARAELRGTTYYSGEHVWNVKERIDFTRTGAVELKTKGKPLEIGGTIYLNNLTAFNLNTQGGSLDLGNVYVSVPVAITVSSGEGNAFLHGVGESGSLTYASALHVQGHTITLGGRVEADNVVLVADGDITQVNGNPSLIGRESIYLESRVKDIVLKGNVHGKQVVMNAAQGDIVLSGSIGTHQEPAREIELTAGKNILSDRPQDVIPKVKTDLEPGQVELDPKRTLFSDGPIRLNAKKGAVGRAGQDQAISVLTGSILYVGSSEVSYLEGVCAYNLPYAVSSNKPPLVYFNGIPIEPFDSRPGDPLDIPVEDGLLKSLHPALSHKTPTAFIDGVVIEPRKAPIYYDVSRK